LFVHAEASQRILDAAYDERQGPLLPGLARKVNLDWILQNNARKLSGLSRATFELRQIAFCRVRNQW